jgi:hypothetical protein
MLMTDDPGTPGSGGGFRMTFFPWECELSMDGQTLHVAIDSAGPGRTVDFAVPTGAITDVRRMDGAIRFPGDATHPGMFVDNGEPGECDEVTGWFEVLSGDVHGQDLYWLEEPPIPSYGLQPWTIVVVEFEQVCDGVHRTLGRIEAHYASYSQAFATSDPLETPWIP